MPLGDQRIQFRPNRFPSMSLVAPAVAVCQLVAPKDIRCLVDLRQKFSPVHGFDVHAGAPVNGLYVPRFGALA